MKLYLIAEIDDAAYETFTKALDIAVEKKVKNIELEIKSEGGNPYIALAIYDRIRQSKISFTGTVYGTAMSAATLIIAACDIRRAGPNAWFMVHEASEVVDGPISQMKSKYIQSAAEESQWNDLLEERTGTSRDVWRQYSEKSTYLSSLDAKKLGLINQILGEK